MSRLAQRFGGQRLMFWLALVPVFSSAVFVFIAVAYLEESLHGWWSVLLFIVASSYLSLFIIVPCMFLFELLSGSVAQGHYYEDQLVQRGCDRAELRSTFEAEVRQRGHW